MGILRISLIIVFLLVPMGSTAAAKTTKHPDKEVRYRVTWDQHHKKGSVSEKEADKALAGMQATWLPQYAHGYTLLRERPRRLLGFIPLAPERDPDKKSH
jgi:hypothetical protein